MSYDGMPVPKGTDSFARSGQRCTAQVSHSGPVESELKVEAKDKLRRLEKLFRELRSGWIFVEGKRDRRALEHLGFTRILTISGNLRQSCGRLLKEKDQDMTVFVLTDLDRRGNQLSGLAKAELESCCLRADITTRKLLGRLLKVRCFEDAERGYGELLRENEKN